MTSEDDSNKLTQIVTEAARLNKDANAKKLLSILKRKHLIGDHVSITDIIDVLRGLDDKKIISE